MDMTRRSALKKLAAGAGVGSLLGYASPSALIGLLTETGLEGRVKHSVCKWCYPDISLEELCRAGKEIGLQSIELLGPGDWPILKEHGLSCAMPNGAEIGLTEGFNDPRNHDELASNYEAVIPQVAEAGFDKIICFSGNRNGMDDETGLKNCEEGIKRILKTAEQHDVILTMELLNSKIDHPDYQCDNTPWGVELCKRVGSDHFKLLYDIYHMQIMEGDVIRTIQENHEYIAHYHTGGVPGRNEIDSSQELNYPAIVRAIVETGYEGYIGQEFIPTWEDELKALEEGIQICDVST